MKAHLSFSLPEEQAEHLVAVLAGEIYSTLAEVQRHVRDRLKYADVTDAVREELEAVRAIIAEADLPESLRP